MNIKAIRIARAASVFRLTLLLVLAVLIFLILPLPVGSTGDVPENKEAPNNKIEHIELIDPKPDIDPVVDEITIDVIPETTEPQETIPTEPVYEKLYTEADVIALAKMAWGEALVTRSDTEMAATMWCVLNRFDCDDPYYKNCKTIESIVKQSDAFAGYSARNPEDEYLIWLATDVLDRWNAEQHGETDVGRVLPADYLFFHGDGKDNHFRKEYRHNGQYWDWSLESPYET